MKKEYISPTAIKYEFIEEYGVLGEISGVIGSDVSPAKENNFTFDIEDPYELWGDESGDDDWLVDNDN